uniref:Large ribosomal subunit protein P1 n=1 Tax=Staphylothermus marinus TaxID=2280 RepID=A0A7C4D7Y2_STAMA
MEYIYASLLLYKAGKEISEENVKKILEAAGIAVDEIKVKSLVAALKNIDIAKVIEQATSTQFIAAPVAVPTPSAPAETTESKKEEEREEEKEKTVSEEELAEGLGAIFG